MPLHDTLFIIITSEHIVLQALVPMLFLFVLTLLFVGKQLRDVAISLCIFCTIILFLFLFPDDIRKFCIIQDIKIPFVHHDGNIDEFSLFICAGLSLILSLVVKRCILLYTRFTTSRIADFEGEWHYCDDIGQKRKLIIEVYPHEVTLTPMPECLRGLIGSDGKRHYTFRHEKKTLSICDELSAFELIRFTLRGRRLKASASDGTWTVRLKKRKLQKIADISDGSTLADWFLGHPDFSPEIFLRNEESISIEYKSGIRKTGHDEFQNKSDEWRVAQGLLSMGNSEGGLLVIGLSEQPGRRVFLELDPAYGFSLSNEDAAEEFIRKKLLPWTLPSNGIWVSKESHKAFFVCEEDKSDFELWRAEIRIRRIRGTEAFLFFVPASPHPIRLIQAPSFNGTSEESWLKWVGKEKNVPKVVLPIRQGSGASVTMLEGSSMGKAMLRPRTNSIFASFRALSLKLNVLLSEKE